MVFENYLIENNPSSVNPTQDARGLADTGNISIWTDSLTTGTERNKNFIKILKVIQDSATVFERL